MLDNALPNLKGEIQSRKVGVTLLEGLHDPQRVQIVVKPVAEALHDLVQAFLARMAERRVADVMDQSQGLDQIHVQSHQPGDRARDLGDLNRMGQPVAEMIGEARREDLRLVFQPPKGPGMENAVAIPLVIVAIAVQGFREPASPTLFRSEGKVAHDKE